MPAAGFLSVAVTAIARDFPESPLRPAMDATRVTIREVSSVGPDTVALELETPGDFDAHPGQFVLVRADVDGEEVARHYTLSSPGVGETFEITVGIDPEGDLSPWLADRDPGDSITVEGPFGTVSYDAGTDGDVVVVAGGPGVGPAVGVGEAAATAGQEVAIVYEDGQPAHQDRLAALAATGAEIAVVTDESLEAAIARVVGPSAAPGDDSGAVFAFGFRDFLDRALPALETAGVDREDARVENFG